MAKALGHTQYNANLLSHYLPEPILAFFQTRWIRIFQKAFICEAMKDSPYLLEATQFDSMDELDKFLTNHAIRNIPSHLEGPDNTKENMPEEKKGTVFVSIDTGILTWANRLYFPGMRRTVFVSIDTGILTALISLEMAVKDALNPEEMSLLKHDTGKTSQGQ